MVKLESRFGKYGGRFVSQILVPPLVALEKAYLEAVSSPSFQNELTTLLADYLGRPTPLTRCRNICTNPNVKWYIKREDLLHGGAHKTNQVLGQALLAKRMGKTEIIAETGAGQHGVATAMVCALLNLKCRVYMGAKDVERQAPNVFRMKLLGAEVIPVHSGSSTLKDACNEALRDWAASYENSHYLLGTAAGPHPFPSMVGELQKIIGEEVRKQIVEKEGRLPDKIFACVGGGSNAMGIFTDFIDEQAVELIGVEAYGQGIDSGLSGATAKLGREGIFFGMKSLLMQDEEGQVLESHSISAGLDFPSVGPRLAHLRDIKRVRFEGATDEEALEAFQLFSEKEGIIPALESSHAIARALKEAETVDEEKIFVVNLSGRGDKDIFTVEKILSERKQQ